MRNFIQLLLDLLPTPKSVLGLLGYVLFVLYPISLVLSALGNADLIAKNIGWIQYAFNQWWGYPLAMLVGFVLLLYAGYKQQSKQQPQVEVEAPDTPETEESSSPATPPTDTEVVERLKRQLAEAVQKRDSLKTENEGLQQRLDRWNGDRLRFKELLTDAWVEGSNLRESKPSEQDARNWGDQLKTLLDRAVGDEQVNRILRDEPDFRSSIFGSTTEQKWLESRLNRLHTFMDQVKGRDAIPFRSGFDPHEWKDWKSPPPTTEQARIERRKELKTALAHAANEGEILHHDEPTEERVNDWAFRVAAMISVALDPGAVHLFYNDFDVSVNPAAEDSEAKQAIRRRLKHLNELIVRVDRDSLQVNPDFNHLDWIGHRPPRIKTTPQTQQVATRIMEIQEAAKRQ